MQLRKATSGRATEGRAVALNAAPHAWPAVLVCLVSFMTAPAALGVEHGRIAVDARVRMVYNGAGEIQRGVVGITGYDRPDLLKEARVGAIRIGGNSLSYDREVYEKEGGFKLHNARAEWFVKSGHPYTGSAPHCGRNGHRIVAALLGQPGWFCRPGPGVRPPNDAEQWGDLAAVWARYFDDLSDKPVALMIGHEKPDPRGGWNYDTYKPVFDAALRKIRQAVPDARIGGPITWGGPFFLWDPWFERFARDFGNRTDYIAYHSYLGDSEGYLAEVYAITAMTERVCGRRIPVFNTEAAHLAGFGWADANWRRYHDDAYHYLYRVVPMTRTMMFNLEQPDKLHGFLWFDVGHQTCGIFDRSRDKAPSPSWWLFDLLRDFRGRLLKVRADPPLRGLAAYDDGRVVTLVFNDSGDQRHIGGVSVIRPRDAKIESTAVRGMWLDPVANRVHHGEPPDTSVMPPHALYVFEHTLGGGPVKHPRFDRHVREYFADTYMHRYRTTGTLETTIRCPASALRADSAHLRLVLRFDEAIADDLQRRALRIEFNGARLRPAGLLRGFRVMDLTLLPGELRRENTLRLTMPAVRHPTDDGTARPVFVCAAARVELPDPALRAVLGRDFAVPAGRRLLLHEDFTRSDAFRRNAWKVDDTIQWEDAEKEHGIHMAEPDSGAVVYKLELEKPAHGVQVFARAGAICGQIASAGVSVSRDGRTWEHTDVLEWAERNRWRKAVLAVDLRDEADYAGLETLYVKIEMMAKIPGTHTRVAAFTELVVWAD